MRSPLVAFWKRSHFGFKVFYRLILSLRNSQGFFCWKIDLSVLQINYPSAICWGEISLLPTIFSFWSHKHASKHLLLSIVHYSGSLITSVSIHWICILLHVTCINYIITLNNFNYHIYCREVSCQIRSLIRFLVK